MPRQEVSATFSPSQRMIDLSEDYTYDVSHMYDVSHAYDVCTYMHTFINAQCTACSHVVI